MQPRLAYTAAVEVPPFLCQTSKGDGSAYIPISPASRNLVEPSSTVPKPLTANEVVASSTQKSSGQSSTDIIPVYPGGDPKDLSTKERTTKEGLTSLGRDDFRFFWNFITASQILPCVIETRRYGYIRDSGSRVETPHRATIGCEKFYNGCFHCCGHF